MNSEIRAALVREYGRLTMAIQTAGKADRQAMVEEMARIKAILNPVPYIKG